MNMAISDDDAASILNTMSSRGFNVILRYIKLYRDEHNTLRRITGDAFGDGRTVGQEEGIGKVVLLLNNMKEESNNIVKGEGGHERKQ
ncbi:MAG: hypothetical protein PHW65_00100 [Dehalococcoidales bacterium]|nr:hypothetical protein [Dehalococcoidales bacterium]